MTATPPPPDDRQWPSNGYCRIAAWSTPGPSRRLIEVISNRLMQMELESFTGAAHGERSPARIAAVHMPVGSLAGNHATRVLSTGKEPSLGQNARSGDRLSTDAVGPEAATRRRT